MRQDTLNGQVEALEQLFEKSHDGNRNALRGQVQRIIRTLADQKQPIPRRLKRINADLEREAEEDLFDNMPV